MKYRRGGLLLLLALLACAPLRAQEPEAKSANDERLQRILEKAGEAVARYQSGLFSITFNETLRDEELDREMRPKRSKEFVFETVVLREALSDNEEDFYPKSVRRLKTVDGKPAKQGRRVPFYGYNVQSLGLLLPQYRKLYEFTLEGEETVAGRAAFRVRAVQPGQPPASVEWNRGPLGVGMRFRSNAPTYVLIWLDAESFDVLRLETHLVAPFEFDSPRLFGAFAPDMRSSISDVT